ncbi:hypothetical protein K470DRAFT_289081 [Piedraia hortae CBS 480.64]|uniref:Ribophorin II C-terminal domain-containing protein n=1 Tax=Piedraia hortae CBS 480.64 TaxID=1314780 RepID=A0A6A7C7S2_9PEZI|nr:hypothetical protein K470DRAFT_289081 [Piedraia hortae CBS 480.64]
MKLLQSAAVAALSLSACVGAIDTWSFEDAILSIQGKGSGVGGGLKEKYGTRKPLASSPISLPAGETVKVTLTTTEGKTGKKAHQAFLMLQDKETGLEDSYPFTLKENGKGKVEISLKDIPHQFVSSVKPLQASIVVASFGSSTPYKAPAFDLFVQADPGASPFEHSAPERYGQKPEIHHIFRADPKSPPRIISLFFTLAVLSTLPALIAVWLFLGANLDHASKAFTASPVAQGLFLGSIIAMEGVFFMYYTTWTLFQTLPVAAVVGTVAVISGSRALTEVQIRRFAGER